jgi:TonB family protein
VMYVDVYWRLRSVMRSELSWCRAGRMGVKAALLVMASLIAACGMERTTTGVNRKPVRISMPAHRYPPSLDGSGLSGTVAVRFTVTEDGQATDLVIISSVPAGVFDEAALAAVRSSKWEPALKNGRAYRYENHALSLTFDVQPSLSPATNMSVECKQTLDSCNAKPTGCVSIGFDPQSSCGFDCAKGIRQRLQTSGISAGVPHPSVNPLKERGCIGIRRDLGGSDAGAECLRAILGETYAVGACTSDGWPYNVRTY